MTKKKPGEKSGLPALPTATVPMQFQATVNKDDLANLIVTMEEEKMFRMRNTAEQKLKDLNKERKELYPKISDVFISLLSPAHKRAVKSFLTHLHILDPQTDKLMIKDVNIKKGVAGGNLSNLVPSFMGPAPRGKTSILIPLQVKATQELEKLHKRANATWVEGDKAQNEIYEFNNKSKDMAFYIRRAKSKVTAHLLMNTPPAKILQLYKEGKLFDESLEPAEDD